MASTVTTSQSGGTVSAGVGRLKAAARVVQYVLECIRSRLVTVMTATGSARNSKYRQSLLSKLVGVFPSIL